VELYCGSKTRIIKVRAKTELFFTGSTAEAIIVLLVYRVNCGLFIHFCMQ
jgi:hypothetical protein